MLGRRGHWLRRGGRDPGWRPRAGDPERAAAEFATLVARSLSVFLEVGAWAAKDKLGAMVLARQILLTLADAVGGPLDPDAPTTAGLAVIESAFGIVLRWALEPEWPVGPVTSDTTRRHG